MTDDRVVDIRQYLERAVHVPIPRVFSVWGGEGRRSRFALPVWRVITLLGGDWGGIVSLSRLPPGGVPEALFVMDLQQSPARTGSPPDPLRVLQNQEAPSIAVSPGAGLAVLLGTDEERWWFLRVSGGASEVLPEGRARETLLFLAGECAGLLFLRELATPLPSSSSAP